MRAEQTSQHEELAAQLDREGFVVWPGLLPHDAVDRHLEQYEAMAGQLGIDTAGSQVPQDLERRAVIGSLKEKLHYDSKEAGLLWLNPRLLAFAQWRFGATPVLRIPGTHLFSVGSHLHSDFLATAAPDPWEREFRAWGALEDIDPASGLIYFLPGSHHTIMATIREELLESRPEMAAMMRSVMQPVPGRKQLELLKDWHEIVMSALQDRIDRLGVQRVVPKLSKGDVIIFNPGIAHGTLPSERSDLTRKATIWNLGAEGATYYMPRAYWGALHDHRCPENGIRFDIEQSPAGLRVRNYMETWNASLARPILAC